MIDYNKIKFKEPNLMIYDHRYVTSRNFNDQIVAIENVLNDLIGIGKYHRNNNYKPIMYLVYKIPDEDLFMMVKTHVELLKEKNDRS